ncbi:SEC-C metal-binding domain-containing protein [Sphingomonas hengshuiensis]|uniref:SEC-C metal-binding domain-containing protein n=1 Tax=Sphingomonas hengshuiensis TaxID=1609977 RepID=UPI001D1039C5
MEKLGRNDPCPCGSGKSFQALLPKIRPVSTGGSGMTIGANNGQTGPDMLPGPVKPHQSSRSIHCLIAFFGIAPTWVAACWPFLNRIIVGMPRTP